MKQVGAEAQAGGKRFPGLLLGYLGGLLKLRAPFWGRP